MKLAVVVIARNEERHIAACLARARASLAAAGGGELLLVDAGSTDKTASLAARVQGVRVAKLERPPYHAAVARNHGLALVDADVVQFVDGDMVLDTGWLRRAVRELQSTRAAAVDGWLEERGLHTSLWNATFGLDWPRDSGPVDRLGGAAAWRSAALQSLGGFDESLTVGEDPDLALRARAAGMVLHRSARSMASHDLGLAGARDWWNRALSVGRSRREVARRHVAAGPPLKRAALAAGMVLAAPLLALSHPVLGAAAALALVARLTRFTLRDLRRGVPLSQAMAHGLHLVLVPLPVLLGALKAPRGRGPKASSPRRSRSAITA